MYRLTTLFLLLIGNVASAQQPTDREFVEKADALLNDYIRANNVRGAADFYSEQFVLTTSAGKLKRKADILAEIGSPDLTLEINRTDDVQVLIEGNTAILTGKLYQKGSYKQRSFDVVLLVTDTWIRTPAGWKILAGHASLIQKL